MRAESKDFPRITKTLSWNFDEPLQELSYVAF